MSTRIGSSRFVTAAPRWCLVVALAAATLLGAAPSEAQRRRRPRPVAPTAPVPVVAPVAPVAPQRPTLAESLSGDARADYDSGRELFRDGDFAGALVKFESAHKKSADARLLWNMAACEKNLRHYAKVLELVRRYLAEGGDKLDDKDRAEATDLLRTVEPLTTKLRVNVNVPGAEVAIDDVVVGTSPMTEPVIVDIGMRRVRVRKDDHKEFTTQMPVGGSAEVALVASLVPIVHEGKLSVTAKDGQSIYVDGKLVGTGRWDGVVKSGGHQIRVIAPGMRPFQSEIVVQDEQARTVPVTLEKEPEAPSKVPAWVWIGGGVLLAAGATVGAVVIFRPEDRTEPAPVGNLAPGNVQASVRFR